MKTAIFSYRLRFSFPAKTSRGPISERTTWLIRLEDGDREGWGEINTIPGLSVDGNVDYEKLTGEITGYAEQLDLSDTDSLLQSVAGIVPSKYPALRFGLETAGLDIVNGEPHCHFEGPFYMGERSIPINGLIWMGHSEYMLQQITEKVRAGFSCIKIKVGGLDFETELEILEYLRNKYHDLDLVVRLDANGAFSADEAFRKLESLAAFNIHSIEQPLPPGDAALGELIKNSPIPVALDEELIGKHSKYEMEEVLSLEAPYIILKPSLVGGFRQTSRWINLAARHGTDWWITSALESSVGLNAIAQFADLYEPRIHQGLGTGGIYENNFPSPVRMKGDRLFMDRDKDWDLSAVVRRSM